MCSDYFAEFRAWFLYGLSVIVCPFVGLFVLIFDIFVTIYKKFTPKKITGEIALVTGAAHGLGKCIAIELAKNGCHIAVVDINKQGAEETVQFILKNYDVKAKAYQVDISNFEEVSALKNQLTQDLGSVSILVNNAGIILLSKYDQPDYREVQKMINVNVAAHFWTTQTFLPGMQEQKRGHIVAISSLSAMMPLSWFSHYTSTKFAVRGMMRALRMELKANRKTHGRIYGTTIFPSFLKTNDDVENIIKNSGLADFYPTMRGEDVAKRIVLGIRRNEEEIIIPKVFGCFYTFFEILPSYLQDFILHHILVARLQKSSQL